MNEIKWRISKDATRHASDFDEISKSLDKTLDGFLRVDNDGKTFLSTVDGSKPSEKIRLVISDDFKSRTNLFHHKYKNKEIKIFKRPDPQAPDYPALHFSQNFYKWYRDPKRGVPERIISRIERDEIHPVCPFCTCDLPREQLNQTEQARIVKLGLIGPAGSGKTSLNVINILFKCLECGGWEDKTNNPYINPHYLLTDNYYRSVLNSRKLPPPTPDRYIPPLLLRLKKDNQDILLSLMDIPSSRLKTIQENITNGKKTPRTEVYMKLFEQMDGWLVMLDAEREVLPKINSYEYYTAAGNQEALESLLQIFSEVPGSQRKPAALVITKCDLLFTDAPGHKLFETCNPLEAVLWQQSWEDWQMFHHCPQQPKRIWQQYWEQDQEAEGQTQKQEKKGFYSADRHEAVQHAFKPLIKQYFPELADQLERYFSRVDIFPESNLGSTLWMQDVREKPLHEEWVKPFYSAEPILWLLDIIRRKGTSDI